MFSSFKGEMTLKSSQNKTNTLPLTSNNNNNNNIINNGDAKSSFKLTKSSTLPSQSSLSGHAGTTRPEISRPILQVNTQKNKQDSAYCDHFVVRILLITSYEVFIIITLEGFLFNDDFFQLIT